VYTLKLKTDLPTVAAIRLESILDARLPHGGAGRFSNDGSFHVSEFTAAIESDSTKGKPAPIDISSATADWEYAFLYPATNMIDGNPRTRWDADAGYYTRGKIQEPHWAVFGLKTPARLDGGYLSITLDSGITSWEHGLGRFRLAVTDHAEPVDLALYQDLKESELLDLNVALAKAHYLKGDHHALDDLLKAHPEAVAGIGDLCAADKNWERAIAEYTRAITPETKDVKLLAKRAEAYEKQKQWDLAVADWTRASQRQPDVAFERFRQAGAESLRLYSQNGGAGSMEVVDGTAVFTTTIATGTDWHVQAIENPLQLDNGAEYVIRFKMKSPDLCAVTLLGQINQEDWHPIGLYELFVPPSEFRDYEFTFVPHDVVPGNNSIVFNLGTNRGKVMVKEMVLLKKLDANESMHGPGVGAPRKLALRGETAQAAGAYAKALAEAPDQDARSRILDELALFDAVFAAVHRILPDDPGIEEAFRRILARRVGPPKSATHGLLVALEQHRRGEKKQARLAYKKAVAAMEPVGASYPLIRELVRDSLREFGTDGPEADALLAALAGEPPQALTQAIGKQPKEPGGYLARGDWYGRRGLWRKAADDFAYAYRQRPEVMTGMKLGILLGAVGEADRYREHCHKLVDRFAETKDNLEAERTLKTCCLLGPGPAGDPARLARLSELAGSGDRSQPAFVGYGLAKSLYEYRAGRFDAAVTTCRANRARTKAVEGEDAAIAAVIAVEAMALYHSGDVQGARGSLAEAKKLIDEKFRVRFGGDLEGDWDHWLAAQLLYCEAEALLAGKK
jgi:tetratricopeptide (TPR) repeat protein